jgi:hypothetical protein
VPTTVKSNEVVASALPVALVLSVVVADAGAGDDAAFRQSVTPNPLGPFLFLLGEPVRAPRLGDQQDRVTGN